MTSQDSFPNTLEWLSFALEIFGFLLTALNLMALYANFVQTVRRAPLEIRDCLGTLRQQICEEREALRHQTRTHRRHRQLTRENGARQQEMEAKEKNNKKKKSKDGTDRDEKDQVPVLPLTYSDQTLSLHYVTLHDLWRQFKTLERPFLRELDPQAAERAAVPWGVSDLSEEQTGQDANPNHYPVDNAGRFSPEWKCLYRCDFVRRFIWWQNKDEVARIAEHVQKVMLRRMEREVTQSRLMVMQLRGMRLGEDGFVLLEGEEGLADREELGEHEKQEREWNIWQVVTTAGLGLRRDGDDSASEDEGRMVERKGKKRERRTMMVQNQPGRERTELYAMSEMARRAGKRRGDTTGTEGALP